MPAAAGWYLFPWRGPRASRTERGPVSLGTSFYKVQLKRIIAMARHYRSLLVLFVAVAGGCTVTNRRIDPPDELPEANVKPGITVLVRDSLDVIRGKKIGLLTNQTGINEHRESDIDVLREPKVRKANVTLVMLFSPEHGIRGTQDRANIGNEIDSRSGLPVYSLYGAQTVAPPDSLMRQLDALVVDLQDIGTRTWTYVGAMVYSMRAAARNKKTIIVLDRPNPITGFFVEGPVLDSTLANPLDPTPTRPGQAYALYSMPLRHGMTIGEMAMFFNDELGIHADLRVIPMDGWRRELWFDRTGLPWVKPSPNIPSLQSAMLYPGLVAFEGTNLSVGRGTPIAFQLVGAPWLNVKATLALLRDREIKGVRFSEESFTPLSPTDGKYAGQTIPGIRILVTARNSLQSARVGASLLWAIAKTSSAGLKINDRTFDLRFGSARVREALLRGDDPDEVVDREYRDAYNFRERTRRYLMYP
jgi:uncharacterized protein YbbC (DUF1343 family)